MGKFNRENGDKRGGGKRFGNDRDFRRGDRSERPTMHHAVCSECGRDCEVPFRPTGDKPVFCSNCFGKKEDSGNSRFERRDSGRSNFGDKKMFKAVCDKCHSDCEVPFRPSGDKPVFCSNCFGKGEKGASGSSSSSDQYKKQLDAINSKLDYIMKMLAPNRSEDKFVKEEKPEIKIVEYKKDDKTSDNKRKEKKTVVSKKKVSLKKESKKSEKKATKKRKK